MANRKENIDIVFRNGLRDFEASPPFDIWEGIKPALKKRSISSTTWKVAASLAILLSLGIFSYRLGMNNAFRIIETDRGSLIDAVFETNPTPSFLAQVNETSATPTKSNLINSVPLAEGNQNMIISSDIQKEMETETLSHIYVSDPDIFINGSSKDELFSGNRRTYSIEEMNEMVYEMEESGVAGSEEKTKRWSIAALASPTYLSGTQGENSQPLLAMNERQTVSYAGGVSFAFEINDKFSVQSGIYYSSVGQQISGISAYSGFSPYNMVKSSPTFEVATQSGTIATTNADIFLTDMAGNRISGDYSIDNFDPVKSDLAILGTSMRQNFRYLELPLMVRYKFIDGDLGLNIIGGLSSNILVGNNVYLNSEGEKYYIGNTEGLSEYIFSSTLGMGMEYSLSNSISINVEPLVRYYITPVNNSTNGINPFTFGLFSGISFKF